ncbi:MAG: hypothetical protein ACC652_12755, partial [Acidimicrobiales bacterium]
AMPGAIDRLRSFRGLHDAGDAIVLATTDPAQPYGATLPWPETAGRPTRSAGSHVVLLDGRPLVFLDRGGKALTTFAGAHEQLAWIEALRGLVVSGRVSKVEIARIEGDSWTESPLTKLLLDAGAAPGYRGPILR